jgi:hypothetical protein
MSKMAAARSPAPRDDKAVRTSFESQVERIPAAASLT